MAKQVYGKGDNMESNISLKKRFKKFRSMSTADKSFKIINLILITIFLFIIFYPLYYILICSFSSGRAITSGVVRLYPVGFNLDAYKKIFEYEMLLTGFKNTIIYTFFGTIINVVVTIMAAYPLSRKDLPGKGVFTFLFAFTMWFGGGLIPTYLLYKNLGILNTRWVMIIPGALSVWNMVITRTYFQKSVPEELLESAKIDGCSDFKYLIKILLPLSKPIIAVITLYYAVGHWNSFFNALVYLNDTKLFPLQIVLRDILISNQMDLSISGSSSISVEDLAIKENLQQMLKYSVIVVSSIPMLILYPFIQKHFVSGIMVGSLKG